MPKLAQQMPVAVNEDTPALTEEEIKELWFETPMWEVVEVNGVHRLRRTYEFDSHSDAVSFSQDVARLVPNQEYTPTVLIDDKSLTVDWWTRKMAGMHLNDFILAARADECYLSWLDSRRKKDPVTQASMDSFPASDPPGWIGISRKKKAEEQQSS